MLRGLVCALAATTLPIEAAAAQDPAASAERIVAADAGARMERLADNVFAIIHADATDDTDEPHRFQRNKRLT